MHYAPDEATPFPFDGNDSPASPKAAADAWETVAQPLSEEHARGWEMVAAGASSYDECSIFPPSLHEGLHLRPDPLPITTPYFLSQEQDRVVEEPSSCPTSVELDGEMKPMPWGSLSDSAKRLIRSGLEVIHAKFALCRGERRGGNFAGRGVWSLAAVAGAVSALIYMRRRRRREKELLLLLLQEKDQRIRELLNQIALMNLMIASHQQVSVRRRT
ncbi:hypothetical protein Cni_G26452 [Canna indica]|uniref:Uncharacterized protein n=1 Tax=Canna indica TaxID=4628 RepID=A0AAQ3KZH6_9LILI|nr:hypothetical protein Cni_G26452 [Canna indica]